MGLQNILIHLENGGFYRNQQIVPLAALDLAFIFSVWCISELPRGRAAFPGSPDHCRGACPPLPSGAATRS